MRQHLAETGAPPASSDLLEPDPVTPRIIAPHTWFAVLLMMFLAAMQRIWAGGVDLEGGVWLALLLAVPAWTGASHGAMAGALSGAFGALGTLAVLQPSPVTGFGSAGAPASGMMVLGWTAIATLVGYTSGSGAASAPGQPGPLRRLVLPGMAALGLCLLLPALAEAPIAWTLDWTATSAMETAFALGAAAVANARLGRAATTTAPPKDSPPDAPTPPASTGDDAPPTPTEG
jgi:hypothetical protein